MNARALVLFFVYPTHVPATFLPLASALALHILVLVSLKCSVYLDLRSLASFHLILSLALFALLPL